mmetsp:Transcript_25371/g.59021  ORF Transcript_25371/g.59021 Transcript_25371/m.59021 type:complete len:205 (-) Transcript_25371:1067-1681(-)
MQRGRRGRRGQRWLEAAGRQSRPSCLRARGARVRIPPSVRRGGRWPAAPWRAADALTGSARNLARVDCVLERPTPLRSELLLLRVEPAAYGPGAPCRRAVSFVLDGAGRRPSGRAIRGRSPRARPRKGLCRALVRPAHRPRREAPRGRSLACRRARRAAGKPLARKDGRGMSARLNQGRVRPAPRTTRCDLHVRRKARWTRPAT